MAENTNYKSFNCTNKNKRRFGPVQRGSLRRYSAPARREFEVRLQKPNSSGVVKAIPCYGLHVCCHATVTLMERTCYPLRFALLLLLLHWKSTNPKEVTIWSKVHTKHTSPLKKCIQHTHTRSHTLSAPRTHPHARAQCQCGHGRHRS